MDNGLNQVVLMVDIDLDWICIHVFILNTCLPKADPKILETELVEVPIRTKKAKDLFHGWGFLAEKDGKKWLVRAPATIKALEKH